jgi:putative ABC transport system ATP-binding protein
MDRRFAPAFEISGLEKTYGGDGSEVRALRGVDLDIGQGEIVVLLGPSGSGKSTLLNILGGLDRQTAGKVAFMGRELGALSERELTEYRRDSVGFIFQFFNLTPSLTARENVELITEIAEDPIRAEDALALVGMEDRLDHFPAQLSGGEQQRVAVARALAKRPKALFCDEPTGSLDSGAGVQVLQAIVRVASDIGATAMIVSHNASIGSIADRVLSFSDGMIGAVRENACRADPAELVW